MTYDTIHPTFRQALGFFEAYRRLGFAADMIYAHRNPDGVVMVILSAQHREFAATAGVFEGSFGEFLCRWHAVATALRTLPEEDLQRIWRESQPYADKTGFVLALLEKGIRIPQGAAEPEWN